MAAYTYTLINYNQRLWHKLCLIFFFAATADVYSNEGNEAFKKGDFINAIHFYTKGIKMNCNKNWRPNCTTTGLLHILNLVRWWELKNMQFFPFET